MHDAVHPRFDALECTFARAASGRASLITRDAPPAPAPAPLRSAQGGAMASIMVALQRAGLALTDVPRFKFGLFFGSVLTTHPRYMPAFKERVDVPSCHIIGHRD